MTAQTAEQSERDDAREAFETLWVSDAVLIKRLGLGEKLGRRILNDLITKHAGFPKKQAVFGDRRYWPAVKLYFHKMNNVPSGL